MKIIVCLLLFICSCSNSSKEPQVWEEITSDTFRMKVPSGWIVLTVGVRSRATVLVPDPQHEWKLK